MDGYEGYDRATKINIITSFNLQHVSSHGMMCGMRVVCYDKVSPGDPQTRSPLNWANNPTPGKLRISHDINSVNHFGTITDKCVGTRMILSVVLSKGGHQ